MEINIKAKNYTITKRRA